MTIDADVGVCMILETDTLFVNEGGFFDLDAGEEEEDAATTVAEVDAEEFTDD
jgi:hypothetical protein